MDSLSGKNTKFVVSLCIKELTNIPSPSGTCYVKWHIKDSISTVKGKTPKVHIRNYRVVWNHCIQSLLKIGVRKDKTLRSKILVLSVYSIPHLHIPHTHSPHQNNNQNKSSNSAHQNSPDPSTTNSHSKLDESTHHHQDHADSRSEDGSKTFIGRVDVNLSEFTNYDTPKQNRYLLKDSKVNAVLNLEIAIEPVTGEKADFIAPPVKYRGLSNLFNTDSSSFPESAGSPHMGSSHGKTGSHTSITNGLHKSLAITSDPIIARLYDKTFEISWDVRPGELNAFECVDDLFNDGDGWAKNEDGVRLIDLQRERVTEEVSRDKRYAQRLDGTNEFDLRQDMKTWHISHL